MSEVNYRKIIMDGLLKYQIEPILNKYKNAGQNKGLLNMINSPYGQDIATGLLAQSGYSPTPQSFGQSVGLAMQNAGDKRLQRDSNDINTIKSFTDIQNTFKSQDQGDENLNLRRNESEANINYNKENLELNKKKQKFEEKKFNWGNENPEAVSDIGKLLQDFQNEIIDQKQLDTGLGEILGTESTTDMQNYQYIADNLFNGDIEKAILFKKSSQSKDKSSYISDWISDANKNSVTSIDVEDEKNNAEYAWALTTAIDAPAEKKSLKKGEYYYFIDGSDGIQKLGAWNGDGGFDEITKPNIQTK